MTKPRSWWSGLLCSACSCRVIVCEDRGLLRAVLDSRGRHVAKADATCGACRDAQLRKAAARAFGQRSGVGIQ